MDLGKAAYIDFLDVDGPVCGVWGKQLGETLLKMRRTRRLSTPWRKTMSLAPIEPSRMRVRVTEEAGMKICQGSHGCGESMLYF